ncbi:MAG: hypothetical protein ACJ75B_17935 [Flavisolibacter sp.]
MKALLSALLSLAMLTIICSTSLYAADSLLQWTGWVDPTRRYRLVESFTDDLLLSAFVLGITVLVYHAFVYIWTEAFRGPVLHRRLICMIIMLILLLVLGPLRFGFQYLDVKSGLLFLIFAVASFFYPALIVLLVGKKEGRI